MAQARPTGFPQRAGGGKGRSELRKETSGFDEGKGTGVVPQGSIQGLRYMMRCEKKTKAIADSRVAD